MHRDGEGTPRFAPGDMARLRSDRGVVVAVLQVVPGHRESQYVVLEGGVRKTYFESQLVAAEEEPPPRVRAAELNARLTALHLRHPSVQHLYSLHAARIDFVPHQFRPVFRFVRADRPRLLIADDVGVGKTIEAGLILRELQARQEVRSVCVLCPKALVADSKWEREMARFGERFRDLDGPALDRCLLDMEVDQEWPREYSHCVIPFSVLSERRVEMLMDLSPPPRFDLVIVDEAHHLRNTETLKHRGAAALIANADAVLLLTATPIQLSSRDLFVLLNLLRPDVLIDPAAFGAMAEPNLFIHQACAAARRGGDEWQAESLAALAEAERTEWGKRALPRDPVFGEIRARIARASLGQEERIRIARDLEELGTFASMINRTRRRHIGRFTTRIVRTEVVEFTPRQRALHDAILEARREALAREGAAAIGLVMSTLREQVASCLFGLGPMIEDTLRKGLGDWEDGEDDARGVLLADVERRELAPALQSLLDLAKALGPEDPKFDRLLQIITEKRRLANPRVLLFTRFRHTLRYLAGRLEEAGVRAGVIHGDVGAAERSDLRARFARPTDAPDALDVLLCSEVGGEGLDYQFCDCIVNYDIPWNPMRIEQRIGRVDRYGQRSDRVLIYSLVTPGTVGEVIYSRCIVRIIQSEDHLGESEEILGEFVTQLHSIVEDYALTDAQQRERVRQAADNCVERLQEQWRVENSQEDLFGIALHESEFREAIEEASSFWLRPAAIESLVRHYLARRLGPKELVRGRGPMKTLHLSADARRTLREDLHVLGPARSEVRRSWEHWLKTADEPHCRVTFERECARENPEVVLITPVHPLAERAAYEFDGAGEFRTVVVARSADVAPGAYPFGIYLWERRGLRDDSAIVPVCLDDALNPHLHQLLAEATDGEGEPADPLPPGAAEAIEDEHYSLWRAAREAHRSQTRASVDTRRQSLETSQGAREVQLQDLIDHASDGRILRLHQGALRNARTYFERQLEALDRAADQAELVFQRVALGTMVIKGGKRRCRDNRTDTTGT